MSRARQAQQPSTPTASSQPPPPPPSSNPMESMDVSGSSGYQCQPLMIQGQQLNEHGRPEVTFSANQTSGTGGLEQAFSQLKLKPNEFVCEFYDLEVVVKNGIVLQYINTNHTGATCMIGATRIGAVDPRRIPIYLSRNISMIRQHAVSVLRTHFKHTLCSTGVLEKLSPDDYSISFSWASVTEAGRQLHPFGKSDLPLCYAGMDQLVSPIWLCQSDPHPTYVVNVYIQLLEQNRRAPTVIAKAREEDQLKAEIAKRPQRIPNQKHYNGNKWTENMITQITSVATDAATTAATTSAVAAIKRGGPPFEKQYPHLPEGSPPEWNKTGRTPLPDN